MMVTRSSSWWGCVVVMAGLSSCGSLTSTENNNNDNYMLQIHGSGTTNPSKCYWLVMKDMMEQAKLPIRMTYRGIGSTAGIEEFINGYGPAPAAAFGSGDIPMNASAHEKMTEQGRDMVHLPIFLGAVSFFHKLPETTNLNLTSCLLARIFMRNITEWRHADIVELNPNLVLDPPDLPITVARRDSGSSSTFAMSHVSCKCQCVYIVPFC
jgi:ABC-type phosphate transport system substrate-binding protein